MPESVNATPMVSPGTMATPRASNGNALVPPTPGFAIGAATPGFSPMAMTLTTTLEESDSSVSRTPHPIQQTPTTATATDQPSDYFSRNSSANNQSEASSESNKVPDTPGTGENTNNNNSSLATPTSPTEEKKKGLFGKKFSGMAFPKKLARTSVEVTKTPAITQEENKSDTASHLSSSEKEEKVIEDNFFGVIQKIRQDYDEHLESKPGEPLPQGVTPSLPNETPMLNPPPHTTVIIQEDNPESGGLADQYRGEIGELGAEADTLEKIAPMWLGELLLKVGPLNIHLVYHFCWGRCTIPLSSHSHMKPPCHKNPELEH